METDACPYIQPRLFAQVEREAAFTSKVNAEYEIFQREIHNIPVLGVIFKTAKETGDMGMINKKQTQLGGGWRCKFTSYIVITSMVCLVVGYAYLSLCYAPTKDSYKWLTKLKYGDFTFEGNLPFQKVTVTGPVSLARNNAELYGMKAPTECHYNSPPGPRASLACKIAYDLVINLTNNEVIIKSIYSWVGGKSVMLSGGSLISFALWRLGLVKYVKDAVDNYCTTQSGGGKLLNDSYMTNLSRVMFGGGDSNKIDESTISLIRKISNDFLTQVLIPDVTKTIKSQNGGRKVLSKVNKTNNAKRRVVPKAK